MADGPSPIDNRSMLHHYTQYVSHIAECTYTYGRCTPPIDHRCMEYCYMTEVSHIVECIGILLYARLMGCNSVVWIYG